MHAFLKMDPPNALSRTGVGHLCQQLRTLLDQQDAIRVVLPALGDLEIYIAVVNDVVAVDSALVPAEVVTDAQAFNAAVLTSRSLFPLSTIGLETDAVGAGHYVMYGSLRPGSRTDRNLHADN